MISYMCLNIHYIPLKPLAGAQISRQVQMRAGRVVLEAPAFVIYLRDPEVWDSVFGISFMPDEWLKVDPYDDYAEMPGLLPFLKRREPTEVQGFSSNGMDVP